MPELPDLTVYIDALKMRIRGQPLVRVRIFNPFVLRTAVPPISDAEGRRVYMDHTLRSIQDFVDPKILADYHCEDLVLQNENIWQTKMMRTRLDPSAYFPPDVDPKAAESVARLEDVRREMVGIFYGWPG